MTLKSSPMISESPADPLFFARLESAPANPNRSQRVYMDFFGFQEPPFSLTPDPEFLFLSESHKQAIDKIRYGIQGRMGFLLLTGDVGTGKTTLCRYFLDMLQNNAETVYLINPSAVGRELIAGILDDLDLPYHPSASPKSLLDILNRFLLSTAPQRAVVVMIDDAQTMTSEGLENLRLLSNLETDKEKLLQILLVGQPELYERMAQPDMRQLKQRVAITCHLNGLSFEEVGHYIVRRLFIAGGQGHGQFSRGAVHRIHRATAGIPRRINQLCDYALTAAYVEGCWRIGPRHVRQALKELQAVDRFEGTRRKPTVFVSNVWKRIGLLLIGAAAVSMFLMSPSCRRFAKTVHLRPASDPLSAPVREAIPADSVRNPVVSPHPGVQPIPKPPNAAAGTPLGPPGRPASAPDSEQHSEIAGDPRPYVILLGSFKTVENTLRAVSLFKERGLTPHWHPVDLDAAGIWYRVFTGHFSTRSAARDSQSAGHPKDSRILYAPWTLSLESGSAGKTPPNLLSRLDSLNFGYEIIEHDAPLPKIILGAFVTRRGADRFARQLSHRGIAARVVRR